MGRTCLDSWLSLAFFSTVSSLLVLLLTRVLSLKLLSFVNFPAFLVMLQSAFVFSSLISRCCSKLWSLLDTSCLSLLIQWHTWMQMSPNSWFYIRSLHICSLQCHSKRCIMHNYVEFHWNATICFHQYSLILTWGRFRHSPKQCCFSICLIQKSWDAV